MTRKIGILNGGGDCHGLNAAIATVVKFAARHEVTCIGFEYGLEGLLDPVSCRELTLEDVKGISYHGGTILKTTNKGRFASKIGEGQARAIEPDLLQQAANNIKSFGIEALIVIGGDGTLSAAAQLIPYGVPIIGVPKTIDNDLIATDYTFGFRTAVDIAVDALDRIHTTATSHERTFIVECMGRSAGWIGLAAGLAGGANAILLPEFDYSVDDLIDYIRARQDRQRRSTIIVIAEGAKVDGQSVFDEEPGKRAEVRYAGVSELLMQKIESRVAGEFELRNVILGHTQRGGTPSAFDRTLAKRYGVAAVEAYLTGQKNVLVCLRGNALETVKLDQSTTSVKRVTPDTPEYQVAQHLGIFIH